MNFTRKIDRAFQSAKEKMGGEAKTHMSDDFKAMETEMALRYDGMERLQKSMNAYVKWLGRRGETFEDKEKGLPVAYLGRIMVNHGEEFESVSDFGNSLIAMGRANERLAGIQEAFVADATSTWLESLERSLAMMKEYQAARKKLENRRLTYDASVSKMQRAKREDFRVEEELRTAKAKYEESSEDVARRMQDIKEAEADSLRDLTNFLDAELDYHERCTEELRRTRQNCFTGQASSGSPMNGYGSRERLPINRPGTMSRVSSQHSVYDSEVDAPQPVRMPIRSNTRAVMPVHPPEPMARLTYCRSNAIQSNGSGRVSSAGSSAFVANGTSLYGVKQNVPTVASLRGQLRKAPSVHRDDVFADDDTTSGSGSPDYWTAQHSGSPDTSHGSLSRSTSNITVNGGVTPPISGALKSGARKAPPPPPPSRSKKPAPPIPAKRETGS